MRQNDLILKGFQTDQGDEPEAGDRFIIMKKAAGGEIDCRRVVLNQDSGIQPVLEVSRRAMNPSNSIGIRWICISQGKPNTVIWMLVMQFLPFRFGNDIKGWGDDFGKIIDFFRVIENPPE